MSRRAWRRAIAGGGLLLTLVAVPCHAQQQTIEQQQRENQQRLLDIRRERDQLNAELERLRGRMHNASGELINIQRQKIATSQIVNELDRQIMSMGSRLDTLTLDVILTQDALAEKRAVLQRRVADIYKRGKLWNFQVLLAAETFGDLLSRYKYLYLVSRQDESLVAEVKDLQGRVTDERDQLLRVRTALADRRTERGDELSRYLGLERRQQQTLRQSQSSERDALARLDSLSRAERLVNDRVGELERRRLAKARDDSIAAARVGAVALPGIATMSATDQGRLDWPVDGPLLYRMGPAPGYRPNTRLEYRGVGIKADLGTPVRAVKAGVVATAGPLNTYGPSVIVDHGNGFYTLYLYLGRLNVSEGDRVAQGQVIGTSGGASSDAGPHVEFQIRERTIALDPLNWLKHRR